MKDFKYIDCNVIQIHLASTVIAPAWEKKGSAASGGWENYHLAGEHISNLTLNNFLKTVNFL
jgi:hypothetical protein